MAYPQWAAGQRVTAAALAAMLPLDVSKTALQQVTNSTTLVADTHLFLPVVAGAVYRLDGMLDYDGFFGAGGLKVGWTYPSGTTMRWGLRGVVAQDTNLKFNPNSGIESAVLSVGTYGTSGASGAHTTARPVGTVTIGGTAGALTMRWAQDAAHATSTTLWPGSFISLQRVS